MKITAETTDADILAGVEFMRAKVVRLCHERADAVTIADAANSLARAEGEAAAMVAYRAALQNGADDDAAKRHVMDQVFVGADDAWSGRGNDARRARFDGLRTTASSIVRGW